MTSSTVPSVTFTLPTAPPSLNNAYANGSAGGRHKTKAFRRWLTQTGWEIKLQLVGKVIRIRGAYGLTILADPRMTRADLDNLVKPLCDLLVTLGITDDDAKLGRLHAEWWDGLATQVDVIELERDVRGELCQTGTAKSGARGSISAARR